MNIKFLKRDQSGRAYIKVIIIIAGIFVAVVWYLIKTEGGEPHLSIRPLTINLIENEPETVTVEMALMHPFPAGVRFEYEVRIDEDNFLYDDTLFKEITVVRNPGEPFAKAEFKIECKNLNENGKFDLHASPSGGKSVQEKEHQIHAEYSQTFNIISQNAKVTCSPAE